MRCAIAPPSAAAVKTGGGKKTTLAVAAEAECSSSALLLMGSVRRQQHSSALRVHHSILCLCSHLWFRLQTDELSVRANRSFTSARHSNSGFLSLCPLSLKRIRLSPDDLELSFLRALVLLRSRLQPRFTDESSPSGCMSASHLPVQK